MVGSRRRRLLSPSVIGVLSALLALGAAGAPAVARARPGGGGQPTRRAVTAHPRVLVGAGGAVGAAPAADGHRTRAAIAGLRQTLVGPGVLVGVAPAADGRSLLIAESDGAVAMAGPAPRDPIVRRAAGQPTVGVAADPAADGYWLLGAQGRVTAVGAAPHFAGVAGRLLTQPVIGIVAAPGGLGYWVYSRGGRIFTAGRAHRYGSIPHYSPASPVASMAALPDGRGYWLVERNGAVLAFGAARTYGSPRHGRLTSPIVDIVSAPRGLGYWLLARSGRVYAYGAARDFGSSPTDAPALGLVVSAGGTGYWVVGDTGRVSHFGTAAPVHRIISTGRSLVGDIITLDPGHDGGNSGDPAYIDHLVPAGPGMEKACDTTGTETDGGYTEAAFNFDVVRRLAAALRADGAHVVSTRVTNTGVGPCVDQRAAIGNRARSDVALSVHADGGPAGGRGFSVLLPGLFPGYNDAVVPPSDRLGDVLRDTLAAAGVLPVSNYYGTAGLAVRRDLAGLNLSTVPKVLIEVGNMRNALDAGLQVQAAWRQRIADVLAEGLTSYLLTTGP